MLIVLRKKLNVIKLGGVNGGGSTYFFVFLCVIYLRQSIPSTQILRYNQTII